MSNQAWAENAVIIQDNGCSVRFRPKCPYCGHIPMNMSMGDSAQNGVRSHNSAICEKCKKTFDIVISRG